MGGAMAKAANKSMYKVTFMSRNEVYEVYARAVYAADLYGFVAVEDLQFNEADRVVVDPSEERLQHEFAGVRRFFVPMHAIMRIDEVSERGEAKIRALPDKVVEFPSPIYTKTKDGK